MVVIGKPNEEKESNNGSYEGLEEFSDQILGLGHDIKSRLKKKRELEDVIREKDTKLRAMQRDIFDLKDQLAKVKSELLKLERRRTTEEEEL